MKALVASKCRWIALATLLLALCPHWAHAAVSNVGLFDDALGRYAAAASQWRTVITERASWLFWTLAVISMVWTFGTMALRKSDLAEFYSEFVRFTIFTGFYWWLLVRGPEFALSITDSLRKLGGLATGVGPNLAPSGIVDIGFFIFGQVVDKSSVWSPVDGICGILIAAIILVVFALVGVNMLLLLISSWILAYAGIFFLGFGGSRWTSEMAIGYFRTVLNVAGQLFAMVLLVGIGKNFVADYYASMSGGLRLRELGTMLVVAAIMLALVKTIPGLIGGLAGGNTGSLGSGFGAGAAIGAATMAGAAISTGGAALLGAAAGAAGGTQALMAAFSKALASESDGGATTLMNAAGGAGDDSGGASGAPGGSSASSSSLSSAMGDAGGGTSSTAEQAGFAAASQSSESNSASPGVESQGGTAPSSNSESKSQPGQSSLGKKAGASSGTPGKTARVVGATVANLAAGAWDVASAKAGEVRQAATERIADTTGGRIAAAIKGSRAAGHKPAANRFDGDSLSAGTQPIDAEAEIAAFRDRDDGTGQDQDPEN